MQLGLRLPVTLASTQAEGATSAHGQCAVFASLRNGVQYRSNRFSVQWSTRCLCGRRAGVGNLYLKNLPTFILHV